ncbi:hypothetical protein AHF37_00417 [Paragonimus kellicotti]|nr:hypothetical protein AHF37_00417 [Paragonimus kellicotti]
MGNLVTDNIGRPGPVIYKLVIIGCLASIVICSTEFKSHSAIRTNCEHTSLEDRSLHLYWWIYVSYTSERAQYFWRALCHAIVRR